MATERRPFGGACRGGFEVRPAARRSCLPETGTGNGSRGSASGRMIATAGCRVAPVRAVGLTGTVGEGVLMAMRVDLAVAGGVSAGVLAGIEMVVRRQPFLDGLAIAGAVALVSMVALVAFVASVVVLGRLGPASAGGAPHRRARGIVAAAAMIIVVCGLGSFATDLALAHRDTRLIALVVAVCGGAMVGIVGFLVEPLAVRLSGWVTRFRLPVLPLWPVAVSGLAILFGGSWSVDRLGDGRARPVGIAGRVIEFADASTDLDADGRGLLLSGVVRRDGVKTRPREDREGGPR